MTRNVTSNGILSTISWFYHLDCFLTPKLFEFLDSNILSLHSVISIKHVSRMSNYKDITLIILDASVAVSLNDLVGSLIVSPKVIGNDTAIAMGTGYKRERCEDLKKVKNYFCLHHEEIISSEPPPLSQPSES